ncbi:MAG: metallophosphoesterase [Lachnospiraceae bacterium]|nr:metallophosphoesterase [Lachnospiraceae bacterium]
MEDGTKVIVLSDTHRQNENFFKVIEKEKDYDMIIHCGDVEGSELTFARAVNCRVEMVMGNNDFFSSLPREREFYIGPYKVLVTHGHDYYVSMGNEIIKAEARARGIDILMYGHTHRPLIENEGGLLTINPGSLTYPRQEGRRPSYVVLSVYNSGEMGYEIKYL